MKDRKERLALGNQALEKLEVYLQKLGFTTCRIGQEHVLPDEFHQAIRHIHDDKTVDLLRYFPDLAVFHKDWGTFLIQVKATSAKYRKESNFSVETASLDNDRLLAKAGIRVLIVWENEPGDFYAQWAEGVFGDELPFEISQHFDGSHTPLTLVKKVSVPTLDKCLEDAKRKKLL